MTFARMELLKSFPESAKKTDVVLVVMDQGYSAQQVVEWPKVLANS